MLYDPQGPFAVPENAELDYPAETAARLKSLRDELEERYPEHPGLNLTFEVREAFVIGACLSLSSTLVVLKSLIDRGEMDSLHGKAAIGWSIVQDIATIVFIVALPPLAGGDVVGPFLLALAKAAAGIADDFLTTLLLSIGSFAVVGAQQPPTPATPQTPATPATPASAAGRTPEPTRPRGARGANPRL